MKSNVPERYVDEIKNGLLALGVQRIRETPRRDGFVCVTPAEQCYRVRTGNPQL